MACDHLVRQQTNAIKEEVIKTDPRHFVPSCCLLPGNMDKEGQGGEWGTSLGEGNDMCFPPPPQRLKLPPQAVHICTQPGELGADSGQRDEGGNQEVRLALVCPASPLPCPSPSPHPSPTFLFFSPGLSYLSVLACCISLTLMIRLLSQAISQLRGCGGSCWEEGGTGQRWALPPKKQISPHLSPLLVSG